MLLQMRSTFFFSMTIVAFHAAAKVLRLRLILILILVLILVLILIFIVLGTFEREKLTQQNDDNCGIVDRTNCGRKGCCAGVRDDQLSSRTTVRTRGSYDTNAA